MQPDIAEVWRARRTGSCPEVSEHNNRWSGSTNPFPIAHGSAVRVSRMPDLPSTPSFRLKAPADGEVVQVQPGIRVSQPCIGHVLITVAEAEM